MGEDVIDEADPIQLTISPEVAEVMEKRMVLADDIRKVIAHAEAATGEKMEDAATGRLLASFRPVAPTGWSIRCGRQDSRSTTSTATGWKSARHGRKRESREYP
jgi:hypothetical protein